MASAQPPAPAEEAAAEPAEATPETKRRDLRDHTYSVGAGIHGLRLRTQNGMRMGMAGPSVSFNYFVGRKMGFMLRGEAAFPMHGRMHLDGESNAFNLFSRYEGARYAFDAMFLFAYRLRPSPFLDVVLAAGIHVHTFRIVSADFNPIEGILGGIGGLARLERRFGSRFFYAGELSFAIDPLDFVRHQNRIVVAFPMTASIAIGVRR